MNRCVISNTVINVYLLTFLGSVASVFGAAPNLPVHPNLTAAKAIRISMRFCNSLGIIPIGTANATYVGAQSDLLGGRVTFAEWLVSYTKADGSSGAVVQVVDSNGAVARYVGFSADAKPTHGGRKKHRRASVVENSSVSGTC